jgi:hypothetical protein
MQSKIKFLLSTGLVLSTLFAQAALAQLVVTPSNSQGWVIIPDVPNEVPVEFTDGPSTSGTGALQFGPIGPTPAAKFIMYPPVADLASQDFTSFSIDFYPLAGNTNDFYLNVYVDDFDNGIGVFSNGFYDCRYDLVPGGTIDAWSTLDAQSTNMTWSNIAGGQGCPQNINGFTDGSLIRFIAVNGGQSIATDVGLSGRFDSGELVAGGVTTTWDFEADPAGPVGPGAAVAIPSGSTWSLVLLLIALSGAAVFRLREN